MINLLNCYLRRVIAAVMVVFLLAPCRHGEASEGRGFWLTRWNARDQDAIVSCLDAMLSLNANILFCQVYGDGMALYHSDFVPRSHLVDGDFDSLAVAVQEGHDRGIEVHAYVNVCNVYSGGLAIPSDPDHLVLAHPEWAVVDAEGESDIALLETPGNMIFFCPEWDGFREYCIDVASEIVTRYDVDGIHLDYLRFPVGAPRCFCEEHRSKFSALHGRQPEHSDPVFIEWRYKTVTHLFGEIYDAVTAARAEVTVSASLVAPSQRLFQDARRILEAGKLDMAMPMIYTSDVELFRERARYFHENSGGRLVLAGINVGAAEGATGDEVTASREVGLEGQAILSCSTLDAEARAQLASLYTDPEPTPSMPWKDGSVDQIAPVISSVTAGGILGTEATVLWHTDERSRGRVEYGETAAFGSVEQEPQTSFDHAVRLTDLEPLTTYHYRVVAEDTTGNESFSSRGTFQTATDGPVMVIVDDGDENFTTGGPWSSGSSAGGNDEDYLFSSDQPQETAWAEFRPFLPLDGEYEVAIWYVAGTNRVADAPFTVVHADGEEIFAVDQKTDGKQWNPLGSFPFRAGTDGYVRLTNQASGGDVVIADAVRFELISAPPTFRRGDANTDTNVNISDAIVILNFLFLGGVSPGCLDAADTDDNGTLNITDGIFLLNHLFLGGQPPPAPYPEPGPDPTSDALEECSK